jgi:hypothetical protein
MKSFFWLILTLSLVAAPAPGALSQLKLLTDNTPDISDIQSYLKSVIAPWELTPEEKCIMSWKWETWLRHQAPSSSEAGVKVLDIIKAFNNYGARICGQTSEDMSLLWHGLGYPSQKRSFGGHTVPEAFYNGQWHMYDGAFGFYFRNKITGDVMGIDSIRLDLGMTGFVCPVTTFEGTSGYSIYEPARSNTGEMTEFTPSPSTIIQYAATGYTYNLSLRPFESYRRTWLEMGNDKNYFTPYISDTTDPNDGYLFPYIRSNGEWLLQPDFSTAAYRNCVLAESHTTLGALPKLHPDVAGAAATVDFRVDAANVITSAVITGTTVRGNSSDVARVLISTDNGATFQEVWNQASTGADSIRASLQAEVTYKYSYIVRVEMTAAADPASVGLNTLTIRTITQLNQRGLPVLTLGSNRVLFKLGAQQAGAKFQPVEITYQWKEFRTSGVVTRTHVELVPDSAGQHEYYINVGGWRNPDMQFVCVNFQGYNPLGVSPAYGYSDGQDVGAAYERPRYFVNEGLRDISYKKKYSAAPASSNDPNRTRLTDGGTDYNETTAWSAGVQWPASANPVVILNLDSVKSVGGVRVLEAVGANQGQYADSIVVLTSPDSATFTRQGKIDAGDMWFPPVNYLVPARWDSWANRSYKYWGIFIHRFYAVFDSSVHCRYVQLLVYNSAPVSIMEVDARDSLMTQKAVPNELNNGFTLQPLAAEKSALKAPVNAGAGFLAAAPNPFSAGTKIVFMAGASPARLTIYDARGRAIRVIGQGISGQGLRVIRWDGLSASGTPLPAGIYLVRLETGKESWSKPVVLVR